MSMRLVALLSASILGLLHGSAFAGTPKGTVLELHSCELYAGGCIVSSEATQGGRYMLRVWNFTDGEFAGMGLAGLQVALLQASDDNLATPDSKSGHGVLYVPDSATQRQRAALRGWLQSAGVLPADRLLNQRVVPMKVAKAGDGYQISAGEYLTVTTASLASCPTGSCGEALWYTPRSENTVFTVAVNRSSRVSEPLLKLNWEDNGKKSVFLSRFGEDTPVRNQFVSAVDLCGSSQGLF